MYLAKHKKLEKKLAIKIVEKSKLSNEWSIQSMIRERDILIQLKSNDMFTQLIFAKSVNNVLLFGLEYHECGDLFHYQQQSGGLFGEDVVRFFIAEILVAVNTLHEMRIIHRDIKRENVLINSRGHLVLGDFGFAKYLEKDELSFTNIGTVGYVIFDNFYY